MSVNKAKTNFRDKIAYYNSSFVKMILYRRLELILLLLTIIGLILKFFYFLRIKLNSDDVASGLMAIEFSKYHNYFLSYYYQAGAHPHTFEVVVFNLLPQILSNYSPINS